MSKVNVFNFLIGRNPKIYRNAAQKIMSWNKQTNSLSEKPSNTKTFLTKNVRIYPSKCQNPKITEIVPKVRFENYDISRK